MLAFQIEPNRYFFISKRKGTISVVSSWHAPCFSEIKKETESRKGSNAEHAQP